MGDGLTLLSGLVAAVLGYALESRRDGVRECVAVLEVTCEHLRERIDTLTARLLKLTGGKAE